MKHSYGYDLPKAGQTDVSTFEMLLMCSRFLMFEMDFDSPKRQWLLEFLQQCNIELKDVKWDDKA